MKNSLECVLAAAGFGAFGCLLGYLLGKKKGYAEGYKKGTKDRENEIFTDFVIYMSPDDALDFIYDLKEDDDNVPLMVIRPEKYDYIDGNGFDIGKLDLNFG